MGEGEHMDIRKVPVKKINPALYNPRIDLQPGDPEYEKLKRSIKEFGYIDPIIWNERTGNMVGGHQRYKILMEENPSEIVVSVVDLDDTQEKALNVALNKIVGEFDMPKLQEVLAELDASGYDVTLTGFDGEELDEVLASLPTMDSNEFIDVEEDDFDEEEALANIREPITKYGDVWFLGKHRLMCGDSTSLSDVRELMDEKKADLVVTDPPYNVAVNDESIEKLKARKRRVDGLKVKNDNMTDDEFREFLLSIFRNYHEIMNDGASIYVFYADGETMNFMGTFKEVGFHFAQNCIWNKHRIVMTRKDYHYKHEPIIYGWKKGAAHSWYSDRKQASVWDFDKPSKNDVHPTMKPVELVAYPINNSSKKGQIVVDLFGGSGSTLIACEQTGRSSYLMELDEKYVQVIIERYIKFVGSDKDVYLIRNGKKIPYAELKRLM